MKIFLTVVALTVMTGVSYADEADNVIDKTTLDKNLDDIQTKVSEARAIPHFENGRVTDFRVVKQSQDGKGLDSLELREGDVVTEPNQLNSQD